MLEEDADEQWYWYLSIKMIFNMNDYEVTGNYY